VGDRKVPQSNNGFHQPSKTIYCSPSQFHWDLEKQSLLPS
jgi:hypothetical protein